MTSSASRFPRLRATGTVLAALLVVAGCGLPEADGTEAAIAAQADGLAPLPRGDQASAGGIVRTGLLLHPEVREAASLVSASADEVRVQRAALFPSLDLTVGAGVGDAGRGRTQAELSGRQLLLDFGDTQRAVTVADIDLQINYIAFQQSVDDAVVELLRAYDAERMFRRLLEVRRKQFAAMQELEALVATRTDIGAASSPDLLETRKRLQSAEFLVHDTELALAEARDRLSRLTGQSRGGSLPAFGGTCTAPAGTDDLRMARLRLVRADLSLERAEQARLPRAFLSPIVRNTAGEGGVKLGLNVGVDYDLLRGGAHTARANAARNQRDGASAGVETVERNSALDERKLRRDIAAADRKSAMLNRQISLLAETRTLYRSQYIDLGTRQISELLDNEEEYYNRQAELIELQSLLVATRLDCARRDSTLRRVMGIENNSLYGFPLAPGAI